MNNNYHIFIASCYEGLNIQIPRLIKNILDIRTIPLEYVHFIVGGCPEEKTYFQNGIEIVNVKYRCFEFTPLIYVEKNPDKYNFDFAFFTHDTVIFGSNFYDTIKQDIIYMRRTTYDTMKIDTSTLTMNIGIYSKKIILLNKNLLEQICVYNNNPDVLLKLKHILCKHEDYILNQNHYYRQDNVSELIPKILEGINGTKCKGYLRNFRRIDFLKYQSNANYVQSIDICNINGH